MLNTRVEKIVDGELRHSAELLAAVRVAGAEAYLPSGVQKDISFELRDTTTELASAIRRTYCAELKVYALECSEDAIDTDDMHIIMHELVTRIRQIPIRQIAGVELELDVRNNTARDMIVRTSALREVGRGDGTDVLAPNIPLLYLKPARYIKIKGIRSVSKTADEDAAHSYVGRMEFRCLELDALEEREAKTGEPVPSALTQMPKSYYLRIPWQRLVEPRDIMLQITKNLTDRLRKIFTHVRLAQKLPYYSESLHVYESDGSVLFRLNGESHTIGGMLSRYCYELDKSIENVSCSRVHESHDYVIVRVRHADACELMMKAIHAAIGEVGIVDAAFKK